MVIADTVHNQIYEIIKGMILERQFRPGERIDPKIIAQEHNISLMPVRDALQRLTTEGLVVTLQRVGFFVKEFSEDELAGIFDTRKMFELFCLKTYFDGIDFTEARQLLAKLRETPDTHIKSLQGLDARVHQLIVESSRNSFLIGQYENLRCLFYMVMYCAYQNVDIAKKEHIDILSSICAKRKDSALVHLQAHLERAEQEIVECYQAEL